MRRGWHGVPADDRGGREEGCEGKRSLEGPSGVGVSKTGSLQPSLRKFFVWSLEPQSVFNSYVDSPIISTHSIKMSATLDFQLINLCPDAKGKCKQDPKLNDSIKNRAYIRGI